MNAKPLTGPRIRRNILTIVGWIFGLMAIYFVLAAHG